MNPEQEKNQMNTGEGRTGPLAGIIVVILVLALGAFYFWGASIDRVRTPSDSSTEALSTQGTSTDITSIETDLSASDFSGLDKELNDIDLELNTQ